MKSSFPRRDKRQSKNRVCNVKFGHCTLEKISAYIYMYIYKHIYIKICEDIFSKAQSTKLAWALQTHFFLESRLSRFRKELFIYVYIYISHSFHICDPCICSEQTCVYMSNYDIYLSINILRDIS